MGVVLVTNGQYFEFRKILFPDSQRDINCRFGFKRNAPRTNRSALSKTVGYICRLLI